jgi:MSHA biogenesis protein MshN
MSLINKMLQDLDRRQALAAAGDAPVADVRTTPNRKSDGHERLWRILAILLLAALAWGAWMAVPAKFKAQLARLGSEAPAPAQQASPLAQQASPPVVPAPVIAPPPAPAITPPPASAVEQAVPAAPPAPAAPAAAPPSPPTAVADTLRLALALETPPIEAAPKAESKPETPKAEPKAPTTAKAPEKRALVDKRDRLFADTTTASTEFRRAMALVNQGRVAEAQQLLAAILKAEPAHANARQVYVSLLLEQGRIEQARRLLEEGLVLAPSHAEFALALGRIHASHREYEAALAVMDKADPAGAETSSFQTLRGAVLQRLGRHAEAVDAYQHAVRAAPQQAASWLGLAISYEALGRNTDARDAYRRSLDAGPLAPAAREYAETRARVLQ